MTIKETIILSKILVPHVEKKIRKKSILHVKTKSYAKAVLYGGGSFTA